MRIGRLGLWLVVLLLSFLAGIATDVYPPHNPDVTQSPSSLPGKMHDRHHPNRLIAEKSPYLLQHAYNPVDWYPWGEDAITRSRNEDKPIFLSIGYSTCYWCHVMEREVFENDTIAKAMNENFVCIKVDREERPDIDRVYMSALQLMTGSGGWPMSMFLTPDLKPFFGGTYIPPQSSYGRPGFPDLIQQISGLWKTDRKKLLESGEQVYHYLQSLSTTSTYETVTDRFSDTAYQQLKQHFDPIHGGFGRAPKFPRPVAPEFLLRYYHRTGQRSALTMVEETLRHMANGGMYDQIGGGFHRYSVDAEWRVPHFEKMLYDQAQLAILYTETYQITHDPFFKDIACDILGYVKRNLTDSLGGFYSAEDAESAPDASHPDEKEEGAYYLWTKYELDQLLGKPNGDIVGYRFGAQENGNVLHDPMNVFSGKNILYCVHSIDETAKQFRISPSEVERILTAARETLADSRSHRPRPHLDDKIITAWNGLMISAYARAYQVFDDPSYLTTAEKATHFLLTNLTQNQVLYRRYRDGEKRFEGTVQDYAFFVEGLLDLFEASFQIQWLERAIQLTETQNRLFWDEKNKGYFDITANDPTILTRTKENYDGAEPTGNAIATLNLLRLGQLTDNSRWREMARQTLDAFGGSLSQFPESMPGLLSGLEWLSASPTEIVIAGSSKDDNAKSFLRLVYDRFLPNKVLILTGDGNEKQSLQRYIPFLKEMATMSGKAAGYVCRNYACQLPTTDPKIFLTLLSDRPENNDTKR